MRKFVLWSVVFALSAGCTPVADIGDTDEDEIPAIAGNYTAAISEVSSDCASAPDLGDVEGALTVSGAGGSLSFDFGDGAVFAGAVDAAFGYDFGGSSDEGANTLDVSSVGVVYTESDLWTLDGDLEIAVTQESSSCSITGQFRATQVDE